MGADVAAADDAEVAPSTDVAMSGASLVELLSTDSAEVAVVEAAAVDAWVLSAAATGALVATADFFFFFFFVAFLRVGWAIGGAVAAGVVTWAVAACAGGAGVLSSTELGAGWGAAAWLVPLSTATFFFFFFFEAFLRVVIAGAPASAAVAGAGCSLESLGCAVAASTTGTCVGPALAFFFFFFFEAFLRAGAAVEGALAETSSRASTVTGDGVGAAGAGCDAGCCLVIGVHLPLS